MDHLYHGELLVITRGYIPLITLKKPHEKRAHHLVAPGGAALHLLSLHCHCGMPLAQLPYRIGDGTIFLP